MSTVAAVLAAGGATSPNYSRFTALPSSDDFGEEGGDVLPQLQARPGTASRRRPELPQSPRRAASAPDDDRLAPPWGAVSAEALVARLLRGPGLAAKRWGAPGCLLLAGVFLQNLGLFLATRRYVAAMDAEVDGRRLLQLPATWLAPLGGEGRVLVEAGESAECAAADETWTSTWPEGRKVRCCGEWEQRFKQEEAPTHDRIYCCLHVRIGCPGSHAPHAGAAPQDSRHWAEASLIPAVASALGEAPEEQVTLAPPLAEPAEEEGAAGPAGPEDCHSGLRTGRWPPGRLEECCRSWGGGAGELALLAVARPAVAGACCRILGAACPDIVREGLLQATTEAPPAPAPAPPPPPLPAFPVGPEMAAPAPAAPGSQDWPEAPSEPAAARAAPAAAALTVVSLAVPLALVGVVAATGDLAVWTRVCLCGALLAGLEGLLAWASRGPPSGGWALCRLRLGDEGRALFRAAPGAGAVLHPFHVAFELLRLEAAAFIFGGGGRMRFCADVPFSGRSYLVALAAWGLYEAVWARTQRLAPYERHTYRALGAALLCGLVALSTGLLVAANDVYASGALASVVLAALLLTSPAAAQASQAWVRACREAERRRPGGEKVLRRIGGEEDEEEDQQASLLVPPCCVPLCCWHGVYVVGQSDEHDRRIAGLRAELRSASEEAQRNVRRWREAESRLDDLRTELDRVQKLRQVDHEHLTSLCLDERRRRAELEDSFESHRRQSVEVMEHQRRVLDQERAARREAEVQSGRATHQLSQMNDVVEQPRWTRPTLPRGSLMGNKSSHDIWV